MQAQCYIRAFADSHIPRRSWLEWAQCHMREYALQEHVYDQAKVDWLKQSCPTSIQLLQGMCDVYAQRPIFGFCEPGSDQWQTMSYSQAYERVLHFAAGAWAAQLPSLPKRQYNPKILPLCTQEMTTVMARAEDCLHFAIGMISWMWQRYISA